MTFIIAAVVFMIVYLYVGWYQPAQNFKKMTFTEKRKFVNDLKKYDEYDD